MGLQFMGTICQGRGPMVGVGGHIVFVVRQKGMDVGAQLSFSIFIHS